MQSLQCVVIIFLPFTDTQSCFFQQNVETFTIVVVDVNEPPVNITINPEQPIIVENASVGTSVCTIEAYDSDFITSLNLTLDIDAGGLFKVNDSQICQRTNVNGAKTKCTAALLVNGALNYEKAESHSITIRATDRGHFISR